MRFLIVTTFRNAGEKLADCIESIRRQDWDDYRIGIIDDASDDISSLIADEAYADDHERRMWLGRHGRRYGAPFGQDLIIQTKGVEWGADVIVWVDGDDRLIGTDVLQTLATIYEDPNVWLTYGQYRPDPPDDGCSLAAPYSEEVVANNDYRKSYGFNHLRTMRMFLYLKIPHLRRKMHGKWITVAGDYSVMNDGLELAGGRYAFIDKPLLAYSSDNPQADWRVNRDEIERTHVWLRGLTPLQPLAPIMGRRWENDWLEVPSG